MTAAFCWPVRVYYEDTDAGGIVFYANYLKFFERARTEWLRAAGVEQQSLAEQDGVVFVVKNAVIDYHAPAKLDDRLEISVSIEKLGRASVVFVQEAVRHEGAGSQRLCSARVRVGCVSHDSMRPASMPDSVIARLQQRLATATKEK